MISLLLLMLALNPPAADAPGAPSQHDLDFFEKRVRPVLAEHCYACHSAESDKLKAGLRLDSREALLSGGDSGPAAVPGDPEHSLMIKAVRHLDKDLQMPPRKGKLPEDRIEDLARWVQIGLPWPAESQSRSGSAKRTFAITESDRAYWAFQPVRKPALPAVQNKAWIENGIDAFVLAQLEAKGLTPNPPATRRELARRVYFDLLGLPPRPEELAAFIHDPSPDAYERLVDSVLARPEYGERWARHWLDVVRYAQSNGYERDSEKPLAWRYRDYVIRALNEDKPYSRFIQEQIAGDELADATADSVVATGFQRLGVWDDEPDDPKMAEFDALDDIISTTGAAFLGLTLGCARCHDHKFDPISQSDYYSFLAFFRQVRPNEAARFDPESANYLPLAVPEQARSVQREKAFQRQSLESRLACAVEGSAKEALSRALQQLKNEPLPFEWALGVRERQGRPLPTHILVRGNANSPGAEVQPGFLTVLGGQKPAIPEARLGAPSSGRRQVLADWIANRDNPLTARVAVNRMWHHHFGQGIVKTTADFGRAGTAPSHPELLDWLAAEFMEQGWSWKRLHRLILLSNTYRLSSRTENEAARSADPGDEWLWRQRLRRLEAENVWDAALSVSGELIPAMGGRGFFPHLDGEVLAGESRPGLDWDRSSPAEQARRSIYIYIRRTMLVPLLEAFDYSNTTSPLPERPTTTVAPQALMLLNGGWAQQRAQAFASRLFREASTPESRVQLAYYLALGRSPTALEVKRSLQFVREQANAYQQIATRLTFRPDAPNSLFGDYMKQLRPSEYLRGPGDGWSYYIGRWSSAYEGIRTMDRQRGPFALWDQSRFEDGSVGATVWLDPALESASLLFRSSADKQEHRGYELLLDPRHQQVLLHRHTTNITLLCREPVKFPTGRAFALRLEVTGPRVQVWIGEPVTESAVAAGAPRFRPKPALDIVDPAPVTGPGRFGVRSLGAALSLDDLTITTAGGRWAPGADSAEAKPSRRGCWSSAEQQGWESFCLLLFNLNEFVYVD
ncbi:MAG: DUF1549 domain-containing protein [Verrucomicrobiota bacterium]